MRRLIGFLVLMVTLCVGAAAWAQSGPLIIDRGRPDRGPATPPPAATAPVGAGQVNAAPQAFRPFVFSHLEVQGSTLPNEMLAQASKPFVGRTMGRDDVVRLAEAIGAVYAKSDVALYSVLLPDQTFGGGVIRVRVIEGYVAGVQITPQKNRPAPALTRAYAEKLKDKRPLRRSQLERQLGLMREIPGAQPNIQVLQGVQAGAVVLAVTPSTKRFEGTAAVNSRGASMLGRTQVELGLHANSLLREGDRTDLTIAFPTELKRFQYVGVGHREPIGDNGTAVQLTAGYLRTKPNFGGFDLTGHATTGGVTVIHPLIRSNAKNLYLTGGLDGLNSDNALFGRQISREHTRALRLAASYSDQKTKTATSASVTVSRGLDILGARLADPSQSETDFTKANGLLSRAMYTERFAVRLLASGQYTPDRLPASEKFSIGGAQFGRAFASAVVSGDSGYAVSAELALRRSGKAKIGPGSEAYVFGDYGKVIQTSKRSPYRDDAVSSAGVGVRLTVTRKAIVELELAKALNDVSGYRGDRPVRLMFNVRSTL